MILKRIDNGQTAEASIDRLGRLRVVTARGDRTYTTVVTNADAHKIYEIVSANPWERGKLQRRGFQFV